jgi:lipid-A-disaccharide synthase
VVALLPGSRAAKIAYILPDAWAPHGACSASPGLRFVLPVAPGLRSQVEPWWAQAPRAAASSCDGQAHALLAACDLSLVASGTATLEAALFKRPMVIAYRAARLTTGA